MFCGIEKPAKKSSVDRITAKMTCAYSTYGTIAEHRNATLVPMNPASVKIPNNSP